MENQNVVNDTVIAIKKVVLEQLKSSKDLNMEYKLCLDFLHNYREEKYKELMTSRTGKSSIELYKYAQEVVANVSSWVYNKIDSLTEHQKDDIMNDPKKMDAFLSMVNEYIGGMVNGKPVFSCKRS